jgi:hypothetical protein
MPLQNNFILNVEEKESLADFFRKKDTYDTIFLNRETKKISTLEFNDRFYGRIDNKNSSIFIDTNFLSPILSNADLMLLDIPAQAYVDLQKYFRAGLGKIAPDSVFTNLFPVKAYVSFHLEYQNYIESVYDDFALFITKEQNNKINNVKDFSQIFIDIISKFIKIQQIPFTRTAFLQSIYCSPYVSGLIVDLRSNSFNNDQIKHDEYIKDKNFEFYLESANRFGFLVDKNAPWRLIFNTKQSMLNQTGLIDLCGYQIQDGYFARNGIDSEESFYNKRYVKAMIGKKYEETTELELLKFMFLQFYNTFIFPNTEVISGKESVKTREIFVGKTTREILNIEIINDIFPTEHWIRLLLYFRALETRQKWNQLEFDKYYRGALAYNKTYNIRSSVDYINNITSNLFDVDRTDRRAIDREKMINKAIFMQDEFKF